MYFQQNKTIKGHYVLNFNTLKQVRQQTYDSFERGTDALFNLCDALPTLLRFKEFFLMEIALGKPLLASQIDMANRLHRQLSQWQIADKALNSLKVCFPGFDMDATLLKVVAINQLYGTQIYAVTSMAQHITEIMPNIG